MGRRRHAAPQARDDALRRLRGLTALAAAGGTALAAAFAGLAANAVPGRKVVRVAGHVVEPAHAPAARPGRRTTHVRHAAAPAPTSAPASTPTPASTPAPTPPPAAPAPTAQPPVVVSGGS